MLICSAKTSLSKKGLNTVIFCSFFDQLAFTCSKSTVKTESGTDSCLKNHV